MAIKDFRSERVRVAKIIGSSSLAGTPWVQFYSASEASNYEGGVADSNMLAGVGAEVGFFVSGSAGGRDANTAGSVSLFGGDVVISGTMYAEKSVIEVEESTTGSFTVSGSLFVSGGIGIGLKNHDNAFVGDQAYRLHLEHVLGPAILMTRNDSSITDGQDLGHINFGGTEDNSNYDKNSVAILAEADGNWDVAGSDTPGKITFLTTPAGSSINARRMIIDGSGKVAIGNDTPSTAKFEVKVDDADDIAGVFIDYDETGNTNALLIDSEGAYPAIAVKGKQGMRIEQDIVAGYGLRVDRATDDANDEALVQIHDDSSTAQNTALWIRQDGTGDALNVQDAAVEIFALRDGGEAVFGGQGYTTNTDEIFFVSGSIGGKDGGTATVAAFGGDLVVSGGLYDSSGKTVTSSGWTSGSGVVYVTDTSAKAAIGRTTASANLHIFDQSSTGASILISAAANNSGSITFSKGVNGQPGAGISYGPNENLLMFVSASNKDISFQVASDTLPSLKINSDAAVDSKTRLLLSGGAYFKELAADLTPAATNEIALYAKDDSGVTKFYFKNSDGVSEMGSTTVGGGWTDSGAIVHPTTSTDYVAIGRSSADAKLDIQDLDAKGATILVRANLSKSGSLAFAKTATGATGGALVFDGDEQLILVNSGSGKIIGFKVAAESLPSLEIDSAGAVDAKQRLLLSGGTYFKELASALDPAADEVALYAKDDGGITKLYFKNSSGEQAVGGGWNDAGSVIYPSTSTDYVAIGRTTADAKLDIQDLAGKGATILLRAALAKSGSLAFAKTATGATGGALVFDGNEDLILVQSGSGKVLGLKGPVGALPSFEIDSLGAAAAKARLLISGGTYFKESATDLTPTNDEIALYAKDNGGVTKLYFRNSDGISEIPSSTIAGGWTDGATIHPTEITARVALGRTDAAAKLDIQDLSVSGSTILIRAGLQNSGSLAFAKGGVGTTAAGLVLGPDENLLMFNSGSTKTIGFQVATQALPSLEIDGAGAVDSKTRLLLSGGAYFKELATGLTPQNTNEISLYAKDDSGVTKLYFQNSDGESQIGSITTAGGWTDGGTVIYPTTTTDNVALGRTDAAAKLDIHDLSTAGATVLLRANAASSGSIAFAKGGAGGTGAALVFDGNEDVILVQSGSGKVLGLKGPNQTGPSLQINSAGAVDLKTRTLLSGGIYFEELNGGLAPQQNNELTLYALDDGGITKLYLSNSAGQQALATSGEAGGWTDGGTVIYPTTTTDKVALGRTTTNANLHVQDLSSFGSTILITAGLNNSGTLAFSKAAAGVTAAGISLGPTEDLLIFNSGSLKDIDFQVASQTLPSVKINAAGNLDIKLKSLVSGGMYFKEQASGLAPQQNNELTLYAKDDGGVTKLYFSNSVGEQAAGGAFTMAGTEVYPNSAATTNVLIGDTTIADADIILTANGGAIFNEQGASQDFRVESNLKENAFLVDGSEDRVLILSGGGVTSQNEAAGTDVSFYVSGSTSAKGSSGAKGVTLFGGDVVTSGSLVIGNMPGTLSRPLSVYGDVSGDYIVQFDNDNSTSGHVLKLLTDGNGSASRLLEMEDGDGDVIFRARADGRFGFGPNGVASMGAGTFVVGIDGGHTADIAISKRLQHLGDSNTYIDFPDPDQISVQAGGKSMIEMVENGTNTYMLILSGGSSADQGPDTMNDAGFWVSGSIGSVGINGRGAAVFAGDTVVSGGLYLGSRLYNHGDSNTYIRPQTSRWRFFANSVEAIDINSSISQDYVAINRANSDVDFRVNTATKEAMRIDAADSKVLFLSGGGPSSTDETLGTDVQFFVSGGYGAKNNAWGGLSLFGGDTAFSGSVFLSRSIQSMYDTVGTTLLEFHEANSFRIQAGGNNMISRTASDAMDSISINGDGAALTALWKVNAKIAFGSLASTNAVGINLDTGAELDPTDLSFFVSGAVDSANTATRGTAAFGGDVVVSGTLAPAGMKWKTSTIQTSNFNYATNMGTLIQFNTSGGAITGTLPTSATVGAGRLVIFKDVGGFAGNSGKGFLIDPGGSDTVDGLTTGAKIQINSGSIQLMSDGGTSWFIVGSSN